MSRDCRFLDARRLPASSGRPRTTARGLFADAQTYRKWAHAVRRWQQCLLVHDALRVLTAGDKDRLRQSLHAIVRVQKSAPVARWLRVWLACTGGLGGAAMERKRLLRESVAADDNPRHVLRLSVLAAERFGSPEEVVGRLNRLLQRFPDDEFGLARWRMWMVKLANKALDEGRFKQALLQYVSLILYLPDEPDGWAGCAKVLELMDEDKRAADCWRQALQAGKKARERWRRGNGTAIRAALEEASDDEGRVELDILRNLLVEPGSVPTADFPFTDDVLRNALMRSLHAPDVYVRFLLERWAEGPTSRASSG